MRFARQGYTIVLIGHAGHDEVIGTMGEAPASTILVSTVDDVDRLEVPDPNRVAFLTQTTLSLDETSDIVAGCKSASRRSSVPRARTSATPPRTASLA